MSEKNGLDEGRSLLKSSEDRGARDRALSQIISLAPKWMEEFGLDKTLEALDDAIRVAKEFDQHAQIANAFEQKAMLLHRSERSIEALAAIDEAIEQARLADQPNLALDFAVRRTIVLASLGRLPEAIDAIGEVLASLKPEESGKIYLRLLGMQGNYHLRSAQFQEAEAVFRRAISLAEGGPQAGESLHNQLGLSQSLVGQEKFAEAQAVLLEQLELLKSDQDNSRWEFLRPAIEVSHQIQDWEKLVALTKEAMELASRQGEYTEANTHRENLISTLLRLERLEQAKPYLENALDYASRKGPVERKLVHLMSLGRVCFDLEELQASEGYYQRALIEAESQENERAVSTILGRQGALMAEKGDLEAALDLGKAAIARAEAADDPLIIAEQSVLLALTYRDLDLRDEAIAASLLAVDLYQRQGEQEFAASAKSLEQQLHAGQGTK